MNTFLSGGLSLLVLSPALAGSPPARPFQPLPRQDAVFMLPISTPAEAGPSPTPSLRELLRRPPGEPVQRYQLSVEERQRLREQLRSQAPFRHPDR
jgi:hypothetical protein